MEIQILVKSSTFVGGKITKIVGLSSQKLVIMLTNLLKFLIQIFDKKNQNT